MLANRTTAVTRATAPLAPRRRFAATGLAAGLLFAALAVGSPNADAATKTARDMGTSAVPATSVATASASSAPTARRCRRGSRRVRRNGYSFCRRISRAPRRVVVVTQPAPAPAPTPAPTPPSIVDIARAQTDGWARGWLGRGTAIDFFITECVPVASYSAYCRVGLVLPGGVLYDLYRINVYTGTTGNQVTQAYEGRFYR